MSNGKSTWELSYLGRTYDVGKAWQLIQEGKAECIDVDEDLAEALSKLPVPQDYRPSSIPHLPLVLVRDSFPLDGGPEEVVLVMIDGWDRHQHLLTLPHGLEAWIIGDIDLVQEQVVTSIEAPPSGPELEALGCKTENKE